MSKKVLKNFDNGKLSVIVTKIEQEEEIVTERPLAPNEDFTTFHVSNIVEATPQKQPEMGTITKNIAGFGITITRKLR